MIDSGCRKQLKALGLWKQRQEQSLWKGGLGLGSEAAFL